MSNLTMLYRPIPYATEVCEMVKVEGVQLTIRNMQNRQNFCPTANQYGAWDGYSRKNVSILRYHWDLDRSPGIFQLVL